MRQGEDLNEMVSRSTSALTNDARNNEIGKLEDLFEMAKDNFVPESD